MRGRHAPGWTAYLALTEDGFIRPSKVMEIAFFKNFNERFRDE